MDMCSKERRIFFFFFFFSSSFINYYELDVITFTTGSLRCSAWMLRKWVIKKMRNRVIRGYILNVSRFLGNQMISACSLKSVDIGHQT